MDQSVAIEVDQWPQVVAHESRAPSVEFGCDAYSWAERLLLYDLSKRVVDVLVATAVLVLLSPVWIAVALIVVLTSDGPILHRGRVVGQRGEYFTWYKFRTMRVTDDAVHRQWIKSFVSSDAPYRPGIFKVTPDDRITPVGRILRRLSLDEIPQMFNVIRGEMSIVGPRPPMDYEFELYTESQRRRLAVKPGITGLHQVTQRSRATFSGMLAADLEYIERRSLLFDLEIMARSIGVILAGCGAA